MKSRSGFTLIELMVVVIVISIIASIVVLAYDSQMKTARDQKAEQGLLSLSAGLDGYYAKNGIFPLACGGSANFIHCPGNEYPAQGATAPDLITESTTSTQLRSFMPEIPEDLSHPRLNSNTPVNQIKDNRVIADTYYVNSQDRYAWLYNTGTSNISVNFYNGDGTVLNCRYTLRATNPENNNGKRPYPYVLGYFSESENSWKFYMSEQRVDQNVLIWNTGGVAACAAEDIGALKS